MTTLHRIVSVSKKELSLESLVKKYGKGRTTSSSKKAAITREYIEKHYPPHIAAELAIMFVKDRFFDLLAYFPADFILGNLRRAEFLSETILSAPWKFCFWSLIDDTDTYSNYWLTKNTPSRSFQRPVPIFTIADLEIVSEKTLPPSQKCIDFYYKYYTNLYYTGSHVLEISSLSQEDLGYILEHDIFRIFDKNYAIDKKRLQMESDLATSLNEASSITLYHSNNYNLAIYGKHFRKIYDKDDSETKVCFSPCHDWMNQITGLTFLRCASPPIGHPEKKQKVRTSVFIDRIHKIRFEVLMRIMTTYPKARYYMFGDKYEGCTKAGGSMMSDLIEIGFELIPLHDNADAQNIENLERLVVDTNHQTFKQISKNWRKKAKINPNVKTRLIVTTHTETLREISNQIDTKCKRPLLGEKVVYPDQKICIVNNGVYGTLCSAYDLDAARSVPNQEPVETWRTRYRLALTTGTSAERITFDLKKNDPVTRADVVLLGSYSGEPKDVVYFVVARNTTQSDILNSLKYGTNVVLVFHKNNYSLCTQNRDTPKKSVLPNLYFKKSAQ